MRIRSTKPEFWRSQTIAALPWEARLVLKGLESYVDDNGVGKDDIALIASDVFSRDLVANAPDTLARLSEAISALAEGALIVRYQIDGEKLIYIDRWKQHQRIDKPAKGRFRRPDGTLEYLEDVNRDSYRKPRETVASPPEILAPGTGEQGNRGTEDQGNSIAPKPAREADEIWDAVLEVCNVDSTAIPTSARGAYNRAVADLKAVKATAPEIRRRAAIFRGQWRDASLTPTALARRWAECERPVTTGPAPSRNGQILAAAMERAAEAGITRKAIGS